MIIKGLQKTTLLDFPTKVACTVFTGGCNFRCPFCHNASLVLDNSLEGIIGTDAFFEFLRKRQGILDGVCITGGEPLIQKDIAEFIRAIRSLGFAVKLDTNGSFPEKLFELINQGLIDYVAMDVKNCPDKYSVTAGTDKYTERVMQSVEILLSDVVDYEFRTTVVKELHTVEDMEGIGKWIKGAKRYFLQGFIDSGDLIEEGLSGYSKEEMEVLLSAVREYVPSAQIRGL